MKGSDITRLTEINLLAEAIAKVEAITFADNTQKDAFLIRAKAKLDELISEFVGN